MHRYAATVGTFDGLHLGHQDLLRQLRNLGNERGMETCVITFMTHPLSVVAPERCPLLLGKRPRKENMEGIDRVTSLQFTSAMAAMTARQFIRLLRDRYDVGILLMGYNNRIGSDGIISPCRYATIGAEEGVEIHFATPYEKDGLRPASSAIRRALEEGRVDIAAKMLGRSYSIDGTAVPGKQNGRKIGFPTLNLMTDPARQLPSPGVYAGYIAAPSGMHPAVINIGNNPTIASGNPQTVEAHALDGEIPEGYGDSLEYVFVTRLRGEKKFKDIDELRQAIALDIKNARAIL